MTTLLNANIDERVKNMEITSDEMKRIQTALKDEEFRKLFTSYAEEISNPENRKLYESEISQMESQRGMYFDLFRLLSNKYIIFIFVNDYFTLIF